MSHIRIFDNPKGPWLRAGQWPPLTLTGALASYEPGDAYEGRLQIGNAQGDVVAWQSSGDVLPPGTTITVVGSEVVVAWPAYAVLVDASASILNSGFELGDNGDWIKGAGWAIGEFSWEYDGDDNDEQHYDGTKAAEYQAGARGNSRITSAQPRLCGVGVSVTASCHVQQGPSEAGHTGGWVLLQFLNAAGAVLAEHAGNHVDSGSDAEWNLSTVTATSPAGTVTARIGAEAYRTKESKPMWVDAFAWNLAPGVSEAVGTNGTANYALCITIRDSAGRTATWCGSISTNNYNVLPFFVSNTVGGQAARGTYAVPVSGSSGITDNQMGEQILPIGGDYAVTYGTASVLSAWKLNRTTGLYQSYPITNPVTSTVLAMSRDGQWFVALNGTTFYIFHNTGSGFDRVGTQAASAYNLLNFSPDGARLAAAVTSGSGTARLWSFDTTTGAMAIGAAVTPSLSFIGALAWSRDGVYLAVGRFNSEPDPGTLHIYLTAGVASFTAKGSIGAMTGNRSALAWNRDGTKLYYSSVTPNRLNEASFNGTAPSLLTTHNPGPGDYVSTLQVNAEGTHLIAMMYSSNARIFEIGSNGYGAGLTQVASISLGSTRGGGIVDPFGRWAAG